MSAPVTTAPLGAILKQAALVGAVGAIASTVFLNGMRPVRTPIAVMPMAVVNAAALASASVVSAYATPFLTQRVLNVNHSSTLSKLEAMLVQPLITGSALLVTEALISHDAEAAAGSMALLGFGIASQVGAAYTSNALGWTSSVVN